LRQGIGGPGGDKAEHVAEIVAGIGQERHRVADDPEHALDDDEAEIECRRQREDRTEAIGRYVMMMAMMGMAVILVVVLLMAMIVMVMMLAAVTALPMGVGRLRHAPTLRQAAFKIEAEAPQASLAQVGRGRACLRGPADLFADETGGLRLRCVMDVAREQVRNVRPGDADIGERAVIE
jgi:hypothetical protein